MDRMDRQAVEAHRSGEWPNPFDDEQECDECGHKISLHEDEYGCDYEADRPDPDIGQVAWRCGCKEHGPARRAALQANASAKCLINALWGLGEF